MARVCKSQCMMRCVTCCASALREISKATDHDIATHRKPKAALIERASSECCCPGLSRVCSQAGCCMVAMVGNGAFNRGVLAHQL